MDLYTDQYFSDAVETFKDKKGNDLSPGAKSFYAKGLQWFPTLIDEPDNKNLLWIITHPTKVFRLMSETYHKKTKKPISSRTMMKYLGTFMVIFSNMPDLKGSFPKEYKKYKKLYNKMAKKADEDTVKDYIVNSIVTIAPQFNILMKTIKLLWCYQLWILYTSEL